MQTQSEEKKVLTNGWGIDLCYKDANGEWHETSRATIDALLKAMGAEPDALAPPRDISILVVRSGEQHEVGTGEITLESGDMLAVSGRLPADLPLGYHTIQVDGSEKLSRLIVGPPQCWLPEGLETWGWAVQLYGARSAQSWGIGDLADLEMLAKWSAGMGAGMLLVNPLSAPIPVPDQQASPYYPSSRRFLNPLWLHIEWIPGAEQLPQYQELAESAKALNQKRLIDRNLVFELKMQALASLWLCFTGDESFTKFCRSQGSDLETYATFCALAEDQQSGWREWPQELRHPASPAVHEYATTNRHRVDFHKWVQWLLDQQLARCGGHLALMQDLPIGCDPNGADCWAWQDLLADGASVGAPPDEFNTQGQNWGLPPFVPHKLRAAGYEPFIQTVRAAMRNTGGLRIDHVMGLFRLFWIPENMDGSRGAYVRYEHEEMLTIVALESERARAYVVGEDLGTVEDEARRQLSASRILSYRLLWFEKTKPIEYPREALAAITTHDLPTVAGLWGGSDFARQQEFGLKPNEKSTYEIQERLEEMAGLKKGDTMAQVVEKAYQLLGQAPSRILTASLDDAAQVEERPNLPATMLNQNWSMALPVPLEELMVSELPRKIAEAISRTA